jgi:apolipoprotein N-acyltransferase
LLLLSLSNRPLILHPTYKKVVSAIVIGIAVFAMSPNKSNELLVFTFSPLAMIATAHIETPQTYWKKEVILWIVLMVGFFTFFKQS